MDPGSDADCIAAVRAGDIAAFEPLIKKYQGRVFATVRRYTRREADAEDLVQEIFLKAYRKLPTFRSQAPFEHWLMRLAVRSCYDFLRRSRHARELLFTDMASEDAEAEDFLPSISPAPAEERLAAKQLVDQLLSRLPPAGRLVLTLLELEERSVKEISELTGWSTALVKVRAFRARQTLRSMLKQIDRDKFL
jgi:RNA polymerase sigma-70 factor (ECF subfamily)